MMLPANWRVMVIVMGVVLALGGSFLAGAEWNDRGWVARDNARIATESAQSASAQSAARIIEQGRDVAREESVKYANEQAAQARADADAAGAAVDRMLKRASAEAARREAADQTAAIGRATGEKTARMYADLLKGTGDIARRYAGIAERAITAGEVCEMNYDAVQKAQ